MNKKIISITILSLVLTGCSEAPSKKTSVPLPDVSPTVVELTSESEPAIQRLLYNPKDQTVYGLSRHGQLFFLYKIHGHTVVKPALFQMKIPKNTTLSCFQFDESGTLYAIRTVSQKGSQLVGINQKKGTCKVIPLKSFPRKKICHMQFSGSKLALICENNRAFLYNIMEGRQLGYETLHATSGYFALCNEHFISQNYDKERSAVLCTDTDYRTGDVLQTFPLISGVTNFVGVPLCVTKETLYLLRQNSLYAGTVGSGELRKLASFQSDLPSSFEAKSILVTRDNRLYITGYSHTHEQHFYMTSFTDDSQKNSSILLS